MDEKKTVNAPDEVKHGYVAMALFEEELRRYEHFSKLTLKQIVQFEEDLKTRTVSMSKGGKISLRSFFDWRLSPLCTQFMGDTGHCHNCPIRLETGLSSCVGIQFKQMDDAYNGLLGTARVLRATYDKTQPDLVNLQKGLWVESVKQLRVYRKRIRAHIAKMQRIYNSISSKEGEAEQ